MSTRYSGEEVLLEPTSEIQNLNILGAKCLVKIYIGQSAFKVLNPTKQEIQLQKGKVLACVSDVDSSAVYSFDEFTTSVNMIKSTSKHCKCQYTFKNSKHTTKINI